MGLLVGLLHAYKLYHVTNPRKKWYCTLPSPYRGMTQERPYRAYTTATTASGGGSTDARTGGDTERAVFLNTPTLPLSAVASQHLYCSTLIHSRSTIDQPTHVV